MVPRCFELEYPFAGGTPDENKEKEILADDATFLIPLRSARNPLTIT